MRITKLSVAVVLLGLSVGGACRSSNNNSTPDAAVVDDAGGGGDGGIDAGSGGGGGGIRIQDVQGDGLKAGAAVELRGVIVTAIDTYGVKTGDIWVEEPDGGPFSGVHVFGSPVSQIATLVPGDIVDITGAVKSEFALSSDTSGRTTTELQAPKGGAMTVTKTGHGPYPRLTRSTLWRLASCRPPRATPSMRSGKAC